MALENLPSIIYILIPSVFAIIIILKDLLVQNKASKLINWISLGTLFLLFWLVNLSLNYIFDRWIQSLYGFPDAIW